MGQIMSPKWYPTNQYLNETYAIVNKRKLDVYAMRYKDDGIHDGANFRLSAKSYRGANRNVRVSCCKHETRNFWIHSNLISQSI